MKLIELEVLCQTSQEVEGDESYKNVIADLNLIASDEEEQFWKSIYFNIKMLEDELFNIEPRVDHEKDHCVLSFFDGRTLIVNQSKDTLAKLLDDTL